jgi:hypothetical protein
MNQFWLLAGLLAGSHILAPYLPHSVINQQPTSSQPSKQRAAALCQEAKGKRDLYLGIWKKQVLKRSDMQRTFFDEHVSVTSYDIECQWVSGLSLRVEYQVTYDWAVVNQHDQVIVLLYGEEEAYRHLPIKRDRLFDEEEVSYAIDKKVFFSSVTPVKSLAKLSFSSYEDALKTFQRKIGGHRPENVQVSFYVPGKSPRTDGYPYLLGRGVVDMQKNVCVFGYMNLVTAEIVTHESACQVN